MPGAAGSYFIVLFRSPKRLDMLTSRSNYLSLQTRTSSKALSCIFFSKRMASKSNPILIFSKFSFCCSWASRSLMLSTSLNRDSRFNWHSCSAASKRWSFWRTWCGERLSYSRVSDWQMSRTSDWRLLLDLEGVWDSPILSPELFSYYFSSII